MIDMFIIGLLCLGFLYGFMLSRKVDKLKQALIEVGPMLQAFSEAVTRSEQSVASMKELSSDIGRKSAPARTQRPGPARAPTKSEMINDFFTRARSRS